MAVPEGRRTTALDRELAPDRSRRGGDATLVAASIAARLLGVRILTVDAKVALVPAELRVTPPPVGRRAADTPARPSPDRRAPADSSGHRLADAVRTLDEGARLLAETRRGG